MPCLICRYFQANEPEQHKADRLAGQCQANCGNRWDQYTAVMYVKRHGALDGWCRLHPEPKRVTHAHVCGDISVAEHYHNAHWGVARFDDGDNLIEWATEALRQLMQGTWQERERERLAEQNASLKRQIKQARRISASRLERLQKIEKQRDPVTPLFKPHLVAAE